MNLFSKMVLLKHLKSLALNRKGLGMELAMLVLLVATGCSMLIVTTAMNGREILMEKEQEVIERLSLDEYAEKVLADPSYSDSDYKKVPDGTTIKIYATSGTEPLLLTIETDGNKIKSWTYN